VIVIVFVSANLTFYFAEFVFGVSGLLSVVCFGVMMAMHAKMRMNPESAEMVHTVISFVQFCLESILFIITGVYIGVMFINDEGTSSITLVPSDYTNMLIFYVWMNFARWIMILILMPWINKSGSYKLGWKDSIVLAYAGVRGSLSLALALIIFTDSGYSNRFKEVVFLFISGMVVLTVIFNGLTIGWVIKLTGFCPLNPLIAQVESNLMKSMVIDSIKKKEQIKNNKFFKLANWSAVITMTGLWKLVNQQDQITAKIEKMKRGGGGNKAVPLRELNSPLKGDDGFDETEMQEVRMNIYKLVKSKLYEKFEEAYCSVSTLKMLHENCENCMESLTTPVCLWDTVSQDLLSLDAILWLLKLRKIPIIGRFTSGYFSRFFFSSYEVLSVMVSSLTEILENRPEIPLNYASVDIGFKELEASRKSFEVRLFYLCDLFPDFIALIQEKQAAHVILNSQKHALRENFKYGFIAEEEYENLNHQIDKRLSKLFLRDYNWIDKNINELELVQPNFAHLSKDHLKLLTNSYVKVNFKAEETMYSKGDPVKGVFIVVKGMVENYLTLDTKISLGVGSVLSWANMTTHDGKCLSTVRCVKDTHTLFVPKEVIRTIISEDKGFMKFVYRVALYYYLKIYGSISFNTNLTDSTMAVISEHSTMFLKGKDEVISVEGGGFLFQGRIKFMKGGNTTNSIIEEEEENEGEDDGEEKGGKKESVEPLVARNENSVASDISPKKASYDFEGLFGASTGPQKYEVVAPMLINPLMNGYYKVDEEAIFFSFKNAIKELGDEEFKRTMSTGNQFQHKFSIMNRGFGGSMMRTSKDGNDLDREYRAVLKKEFPNYTDQSS
jgi:CRP-like cAMP-binding protein